MAITPPPGITYRLIKGTSLTHLEMDNNFKSVFYSSSIQGNGSVLRLHYDAGVTSYHDVALNSMSGSLTIVNNADNRIVTGTSTSGIIQAEPTLTYDGNTLGITGRISVSTATGSNVIIGTGGMSNLNPVAENNTTVGTNAGGNLSSIADNNNVLIGHTTLTNSVSGSNNVSVGTNAGENIQGGSGNILIGYQAGPSTSGIHNNKLYINNLPSDTPLILGDFQEGTLNIAGGVTATSFTGSYSGDGSGLTGVTATADWNGIRDGDVQITGSMTVSGSGTTVNFTGTDSVSGSIFSGSFVGDGSGLTGITADAFPYTGSAEITGSLIVKGDFLTLEKQAQLRAGAVISTNITVRNSATTSIAIGNEALLNNVGNFNTVLGYQAGNNSSTITSTLVGYQAGQTAGTGTVYIGSQAGRLSTGGNNTGVGEQALQVATGICNTAIGRRTLLNTSTGGCNTAIGVNALQSITNSSQNVGIGVASLNSIGANSSNNTAVGINTAFNVIQGSGNVYIGSGAGPVGSNVAESNKLYINNLASNTPLIGGNFSTKVVNLNGNVFVSQSISASLFQGDGSGLTNITAEWDGSRNGDASITGSLIISGSNSIVDLSNTQTISGSIFSGSFVGDGSGLTGIQSEWDGSRNGDAEITGSLVVTETISSVGPVTITSNNITGNPGVEFIHYYSGSLVGVNKIVTLPIDSSTGYTGLKADYVLTTVGEDQKKVGTVYAGWDQSGNSTVNDSHTETGPGGIIDTAFLLDASSLTGSVFSVDAASGTYELNMIITAFKRQI